MTNDVIETVSADQIAREAKLCANTVRRKLAALNIEPDVLDVSGPFKPPARLYLRSRIPLIIRKLGVVPDSETSIL